MAPPYSNPMSWISPDTYLTYLSLNFEHTTYLGDPVMCIKTGSNGVIGVFTFHEANRMAWETLPVYQRVWKKAHDMFNKEYWRVQRTMGPDKLPIAGVHLNPWYSYLDTDEFEFCREFYNKLKCRSLGFVKINCKRNDLTVEFFGKKAEALDTIRSTNFTTITGREFKRNLSGPITNDILDEIVLMKLTL